MCAASYSPSLSRDKPRSSLGFPSFTDPRWVGYIGRMTIDAMEIVRCPAELRTEALALVLCELAPSLRRVVAGGLLEIENIAGFGGEALFIALRAAGKRGAGWGERQKGGILVVWPPQMAGGGEGKNTDGRAGAFD